MSSDLNLIECGLRYKAKLIHINFDKKCFLKKYQNKTVMDVEGNKLHRKVDYITNRILNGEMAEYGEAPWAVYLSYRIELFGVSIIESGACNGVLITFEWILTAAHCSVKGIFKKF